MAPEPSDFPDSLRQALLQQRILLISGPIGQEEASELSATLMALDALGDGPIEIRLNGRSESLEAAFALMDTIDALGVPINATVAGAAAGTMVGPLAVCQRRRIGTSGSIELREPCAQYSGPASQLERHAQALDASWHRYLHRLAGATGQPFEHLEADHRTGRYLDPTQAVSYGLIDEVMQPSPRRPPNHD
jgi:ATP-dependent Clp protease protease subunit